MKRMIIAVIFSGILVSFAWHSSAQEELIIFPKEGQGREQKAEDKGYCVHWAKEETDVDPSYLRAKIEMADEMIVREAQATQPRTGRRLMRGAARGAALGAVGSNVDNNVGKRAIQGGMIAGMKTRDQKKQTAAEQKVASQIYRKEQLLAQYDKYLRAFAACMEAKGYSVK